VLVLAPTREIALQASEVIAGVAAGLPPPGLVCGTFIGGLPIEEDERCLRRWVTSSHGHQSGGWGGGCALPSFPCALRTAVQRPRPPGPPCQTLSCSSPRARASPPHCGPLPPLPACSACHAVVGTPGRLLSLLQRGALPASRIALLVLDEADKLLGSESFQEDVGAILGCLPERKQVHFGRWACWGRFARWARWLGACVTAAECCCRALLGLQPVQELA
jgi:hypothetical protein